MGKYFNQTIFVWIAAYDQHYRGLTLAIILN